MSARYRSHLSLFALALLSTFVALAQTQTPPGPTQAPKPAQAPPMFEPPKPHVNAPLGEIPSFPGDGNGAFKTKKYRDLFAEQGHSPSDTRAKLEKAFNQLFHGDGQEERVYFETGANDNGPLAYITDWANNDARSEGMSYGMMIAVQMDKKREFDAIWNWANTYMLITDPKNPSVGYFSWSMATDGSPRSANAAPDGEEYFVMALYFAANRWGNGKGIYDYKAQADKILRGMRHHPVLKGTGPFRIHPEDPPYEFSMKPWPSPNNKAREREMAAKGQTPPNFSAFFRQPRESTVGPMVDGDHFMIKFVPETGGRDFTDPSYHLPHFYELWARWGPQEDRAFWAKAADVSRDLFWKITGPETGLTPDTCNFDETPIIGRSGTPTPFSYDSWRSVSNWSVDYSWWQKDKRETELSDRIQKFLNKEGISTFADRYTLDGKPLSTRHSVGMLATTAVGSFAATPGPISKAFVDELWNTPVPSGEQRYYDGLLYLMSMLHASGNFRIIEPAKQAKKKSTSERSLSAPTYYLAIEALGCDDRGQRFQGATNLPVGAVIALRVSDFNQDAWRNYSDEVYASVTEGGLFEGRVPPKSDERFHRNLILIAEFSPARIKQPANVLGTVGRKGENLGEIVTNPQMFQISGPAYGLQAISRMHGCGGGN